MKYDYVDYGCTPAQYHAGLDKLWKALRVVEVQDEDVFTLAARKIKLLEDGIWLAQMVGMKWRGDWSDFDGRTLRDQMADLQSVVTGDLTTKEYLYNHGIDND